MSVSEGILKACGKLSHIGALFLLIASCLPAIYRTYSRSTAISESTLLDFLWFFGFYFTVYWKVTEGQPIQWSVYSGIFFYPLGLFVGLILLVMGIITLIKSAQIKKEEIEYKKGGFVLLGCGIASIVSLAVWVFNTRGYYNTGPAVILGIIASIIVIISGILIVIYSR